MTSTENEPTAATGQEAVQQIPAVIRTPEVPAATEARDKLLQAIGREAEQVADKFPGQASKALEELARAFALATTGTTTVAKITAPDGQGITSRTLQLSGGGVFLPDGGGEVLVPFE
ncbi:hypothetical protein [Streptomyces sp. NPDC001903]|uniref:hypothetical protein n=1 Tax=Streptomyces sp. NPDC001903 TaxID=3364622 RepID=UPI0036A07811